MEKACEEPEDLLEISAASIARDGQMRIGKYCRIWVGLVLAVVASTLVSAQVLPTPSYYTSATNLNSTTLKAALNNIIKGHTVIGYTPTHQALEILDADPSNSNNVLLIYSGYSVAASTWPGWNREHLFPESFGTDSGTQHSDLFNLRACDMNVNSSRGNKYYDISATPPPIASNPEAPLSSYDQDSWEPWDPDKGYVARGCFYMDARYNGGGDIDLQLDDAPNASTHTFAKLSTLLDWNRRFPPTDAERTRNSVICSNYQHNRNPFIDNPDFADRIYLGVDGYSAWQGTHFSAAEVSNTLISGTTADPDGDGVPNLAKYALGHDPHTPQPALQSLTMQTVGGTNFLYITHHRHHYLSGVTLTYQMSTNMVSWTDVTGEVVSNAQIDAVKDVVIVRFPTSNPATFVRLKVHRLVDVAPGDAFLAVTPLGNFASSGNLGGPFSPSNLVYMLTNTGGTNLNWTASESVNWLDLSATSGTLGGGSSATVTVSINANANSLTPNVYSDTIFFNNTSNGGGSTTRSATLNVIDLAPVILANGAVIVSESCTNANGAIDPGETVTVSFSLNNVGTTDTSNLVATLSESGGVNSPSDPQTYGVVTHGGSAVAESFTFTASGACGSTLTATLQLQDGVTDLGTIDYTFTMGQAGTALAENFDGVTAPALPGSWTTSASGVESNWVTATGTADTSPNAAFSPDTPGVGVNELDSPTFSIFSASAQLTFRQNYGLVADPSTPSVGYDGGVLEISIGGGSFQDIVAAGGSFVSGGYNATLSSGYANPLGGRSAWSGNSGGFVTTTVNLPATAAGQSVQLRWRCGTGNAPTFGSSGTLAFWGFDGLTPNADAAALGITASSVTVNNAGAVNYVQGNPTSGSAITTDHFTSGLGPPTGSYSYYAFSLTVSNGFQANLTSFKFDDRISPKGPSNYTVQVSQQVDFSSTIYDSGVKTSHTAFASSPMNTSALANSGLTGAIYFRIYGYKSSDTGGTWRLDNLNVQGSTTGQGAPGNGWYIDSVSISDTACCSP
jgi:endonuclease I